jgi:V/A-type H+-transporting ATPase subunit E
MDVQLQELVEKIRKDGVETAEAKAADIVKNAEAKGAAIIRAAKAEAEEIARKAAAEAERSEQAAVSAIRQAGRNLLISFRDAVNAELSALVKAETLKSCDSTMLKDLVPAAVKSWIANTGSDDIAVLLSPADAAKLESVFVGALKAEISKGLVIGSDQGVSGGFRIGTRDGSAYYDFSAEAVADLFASYLNPRVSDIMKSAAKEL